MHTFIFVYADGSMETVSHKDTEVSTLDDRALVRATRVLHVHPDGRVTAFKDRLGKYAHNNSLIPLMKPTFRGPTKTRTRSGKLKHPSHCDCADCLFNPSSRHSPPVVPDAVYCKETQEWLYDPSRINESEKSL